MLPASTTAARTGIDSKRFVMFSLTEKADYISHGLALDDSQISPSGVCVASRIRIQLPCERVRKGAGSAEAFRALSGM